MSAKVSLAKKAYQQILDDIVNQRLPAGTLLGEAELGAALGMSRTPIREALKQLALEGFLTIIPKKGAVVCSYSLADMMNCHEVAKEIDALLAENVANALLRKALQSDSLNSLYELVCKMDEAYSQKNYTLWVSYDNQFHVQLIQLCTNPYIVATALQIRSHLMRLSWFITPKSINLNLSNQEHHMLLSCIQHGDVAGARAIAKRQSERSLEELRQIRM